MRDVLRSLKPITAILTLAFLLTSCGGDVTRAEHDQALAELALTQQRLAESELLQSQTESSFIDTDRRVAEMFEAIGLIPDPGTDPFDQLESVLVSVHGEVETLQAELERFVEQLEGSDLDSPNAPADRINAYLEVSQSLLAEATAYPDSSAEALMGLSGVASRTLDMAVQTTIDELVNTLEADPQAFQPAAFAAVSQFLTWASQAASGNRPPG